MASYRAHNVPPTVHAKIASTPSATGPRTPRTSPKEVRFIDLDVQREDSAVSENFPANSSTDGECLGCKRNRVQTDSEHNRVPGVCRFPHVETRTYDCPGCRERAPTTSYRHTHVPWGSLLQDTRFRRAASAPASGTGSDCGARPPACAQPNSDMCPGAPSPDAPEEADPLPQARDAPAPSAATGLVTADVRAQTSCRRECSRAAGSSATRPRRRRRGARARRSASPSRSPPTRSTSRRARSRSRTCASYTSSRSRPRSDRRRIAVGPTSDRGRTAVGPQSDRGRTPV